MTLGLGIGMAAGDQAGAVNAWERWQQPLTSSQKMAPLQAYHDVQIEATFWVKSGAACTEPTEGTCTNPNTCFKGLAFWDGDTNNPGAFMVRGAFPKGTWCWKTCLLPKTRPNPSQPSICAPDTGLNQGGEAAIGSPSANALYSQGFLKAPVPANASPTAGRNLTYWNGTTPFQWIGDTAWSAPINHAANPALWKSYVTKRATSYVGNSFDGGNGFTNVLVAPAVQTQSAAPAGGFRGFMPPTGCTSGNPPVVPASCHYWDSAYWRDFDTLVKDANDAGIVVMVADVMDPLNRGGSNQQLTPPVPFPARADASAFARNLAARLAGSFVIFSPSFDTRASDPTVETTATNHLTVADLISAVGASIHSAAPRHLIGVHLAGGSPLTDYDQFQSTTMPWLSLQMFQSGHHAGTCISGVTNDYANFACRARTFPLRFRCIGDAANPSCAGSGAPSGEPVKPAVNVEGQYETLGDNETRVQTRHTAWNSGLSGSFGFNIGLSPDITAWSNPTSYSSPNHLSDDDLGRLKGLFKSMPWTTLIPRHDLLVEQNNFSGTRCNGVAGTPTSGITAKADWLQLWKPLLALDSTTGYGLAYLPRPIGCTISGSSTLYSPSTSIVLDHSKANALGISCSTWKGQWIAPGDATGRNGFGPTPAACTDSGGGPVRFSVTQGSVACNDGCDRVLKLTKINTGSGNSPNIVASGSSVDLNADVEISDDGQTSVITGQLSRNGLPMGGLVPLSSSDLLFRKLPSAALDAAGNFLVAWEEENTAGTDDIMAAWFNSRLEPFGSPFVLNDTTDGQQAEPWVSGDDSGNTIAVWTSYSDDDEIAGDIYGKMFDSSGQPMGPEFLISTDNLGNQFLPQVQMDGDGGFVVAWNEESSSDNSSDSSISAGIPAKTLSPRVTGGIYYRVFGADGNPRGTERRVDSDNPGQDRLSRLEVHRHGGFTIRWHARDASGNDQGEHEQGCDRDGNPEGRP
jgi:Protein of unknown function (DUF4038)